MAAKSAKKQRGTGKPFEKGRSGNPDGRPAGSRSRATILGEKILQDDAESIIRAVVEAAKGGDMQAARLCVERLIPIRKGRPVVFPLPPVSTVDDVEAAFSAVIAAMARGELTPDEASTVGAVIELRRRAIETGDLQKRIAALEEGKDDDAT